MLEVHVLPAEDARAELTVEVLGHISLGALAHRLVSCLTKNDKVRTCISGNVEIKYGAKKGLIGLQVLAGAKFAIIKGSST